MSASLFPFIILFLSKLSYLSQSNQISIDYPHYCDYNLFSFYFLIPIVIFDSYTIWIMLALPERIKRAYLFYFTFYYFIIFIFYYFFIWWGPQNRVFTLPLFYTSIVYTFIACLTRKNQESISVFYNTREHIFQRI